MFHYVQAEIQYKNKSQNYIYFLTFWRGKARLYKAIGGKKKHVYAFHETWTFDFLVPVKDYMNWSLSRMRHRANAEKQNNVKYSRMLVSMWSKWQNSLWILFLLKYNGLFATNGKFSKLEGRMFPETWNNKEKCMGMHQSQSSQPFQWERNTDAIPNLTLPNLGDLSFWQEFLSLQHRKK